MTKDFCLKFNQNVKELFLFILGIKVSILNISKACIIQLDVCNSEIYSIENKMKKKPRKNKS